jgi:predicted nucleotidyltransferase
VGGLAAALEVSVSEATGLVADLRSAGLVEIVESYSGPYMVGRDQDRPGGEGPPLWLTTVRGNALAKARIGKPMSRADAQKLCEGVIARAKEVNASDDWLHWVVELSLYGSFAAPGDEPVGDVDLAVHLERRYEDDDYMRRNDDMIDADGARPQTIIDVLGYAEVKILRHLRGRSPRVDLLQSGHRGTGLPPGVTLVPLYQFSPTHR